MAFFRAANCASGIAGRGSGPAWATGAVRAIASARASAFVRIFITALRGLRRAAIARPMASRQSDPWPCDTIAGVEAGLDVAALAPVHGDRRAVDVGGGAGAEEDDHGGDLFGGSVAPHRNGSGVAGQDGLHGRPIG